MVIKITIDGVETNLHLNNLEQYELSEQELRDIEEKLMRDEITRTSTQL